MNRHARRLRDMTQIALLAVLMIVGGKVSINVMEIPYTLQTAVCLLSGLLLGSGKAALSVLLYILLGLAGLPVFARGGGLSYVLMPSFGYLIGMAVAAFLVGKVADRLDPARGGLRLKHSMPACLAGMLIIHTFGVCYLFLIKNLYAGQSMTFFLAMQAGTIPYLVSDSLQCLLAASAGQVLRRATRLFFKEPPARCTPVEEHSKTP